MTTATAETALISCYLLDDPPRSAGRVLLSRVLEEFVAIEWGIGPNELADYFGLKGLDREDAKYVADNIRYACGAIVDLVLSKRLQTYARPLGGGVPVALDPSLWEIDDLQTRFATSTMALKTPFDWQAPHTHWIFVDTKDVAELTYLLCGGAPEDIGLGGGAVTTLVAGRAGEEPITVPAQGKLLRQVEVSARTGMSRSTIYAKIERGEFPKPLRLGSRFSRWREAAIEEWIGKPR